MEWTLPQWAPVAVLGAVVVLWLGMRLQALCSRLSRRAEGMRHRQRGLAAELDAERMLEAAGYTVHARQVRAGYELWVEGRQRPVEVCADLLVHDGRERWVAEVKTGTRGRRVGFGGTRRQLLEYQLAFEVAGVLLVDPEARRLHRMRFPFARVAPEPQSPWLARLLWLGLGFAGALALQSLP